MPKFSTFHTALVFACALAATPNAQQPLTQPAPAPATPPPAAPQAGRQPASPTDAPSQQPPVTFKVEVNYVEVDAIVTDKQGAVVRDLKPEEFEIYEAGTRQRIDFFSFVDVPVEREEKPLFAATPIEPDVQTNLAGPPARVYVIVLDDLHTLPARTALVKAAGRRFVQQLGANDVTAVVYTSGRADASQDFTGSKRLLLASINKFMGRKLRSETLNRLDAYNRQRTLGTPSTAGQRIADPEEQERAYHARSALGTIKNVADFLTGVRGRRKAMILFSEGIDYDTYNVFDNREASTVLDEVRTSIGAATRANVAIYGIDPRGLAGLSDEGIELTNLPADPSVGIGVTSLYDELRRAQDSLRTLSEETGGFAVVNTNDFATSFDRIVRDQSSYYVLAYYPTNDKRDGRYRKIEVKVTRPGLEVRARKGYVAPRGKAEPPEMVSTAGTSPALREALNSPLPDAGFPMAVQAASFKGTAPDASVLIVAQLGGQQLKFVDQQGSLHETVEVSVIAVDASGKIRGGDRVELQLSPRPQTRQAMDAFGLRVFSRLDLPPGRYQLRVGGRAVNAGKVGTVYYDLEVPDVSKTPIALSGVLLTSRLAALTPTGRGDDETKDVLPAPATTMRDFRADDTIALFAEVYDNSTTRAHKVDITTAVRADDGRVLFKTEDQRSSDELQGARGGYGYTAQVPLASLAPGPYVLRVEARSTLSGEQAPVFRDIEFRVWPAPQERSEAAPPAAPPASVVSVVRGPRSGVEAYKEVVARTDEEWQALWASLPVRQAAPRVSFANTMVTAVFLGSRPTSGYGVEIVSTRLEGDTLVVGYTERRPPESSVNAQVLTTPYAVAGVPMHAGPVRFERIDTEPR
jgi:VWFA-related protein